mmetsp:Transcript_29341/g.73087  ORF Transcript_29341/g.73087 Transcript_29341/m.73087 type:complete len:112 (-) Transcript_29341:583-918(-)
MLTIDHNATPHLYVITSFITTCAVIGGSYLCTRRVLWERGVVESTIVSLTHTYAAGDGGVSRCLAAGWRVRGCPHPPDGRWSVSQHFYFAVPARIPRLSSQIISAQTTLLL